jgi:hypothetical protein
VDATAENGGSEAHFLLWADRSSSRFGGRSERDLGNKQTGQYQSPALEAVTGDMNTCLSQTECHECHRITNLVFQCRTESPGLN